MVLDCLVVVRTKNGHRSSVSTKNTTTYSRCDIFAYYNYMTLFYNLYNSLCWNIACTYFDVFEKPKKKRRFSQRKISAMDDDRYCIIQTTKGIRRDSIVPSSYHIKEKKIFFNDRESIRVRVTGDDDIIFYDRVVLKIMSEYQKRFHWFSLVKYEIAKIIIKFTEIIQNNTVRFDLFFGNILNYKIHENRLLSKIHSTIYGRDL